MTGVEPARPLDHQRLMLACLPFHHTRIEWSQGGSNSRPPVCQTGALPRLSYGPSVPLPGIEPGPAGVETRRRSIPRAWSLSRESSPVIAIMSRESAPATEGWGDGRESNPLAGTVTACSLTVWVPSQCTRRESNPRPSPCERAALPLGHRCALSGARGGRTLILPIKSRMRYQLRHNPKTSPTACSLDRADRVAVGTDNIALCDFLLDDLPPFQVGH